MVAAGDGCRVLYLDDDETMALVVEQLLRRAGYLATIFQDAQRALAAVRAEPQGFDIVVTDFNMPRLSGLDVARQLAEIRADLPVIISSGYIDSSLRADSEKTNVRALLNKERTAEDLIPLIAGVMAVATASA